MAAAEEKYRRLPGHRHGLISGSSLWMGSDHILLVKSAWFREEYKRFYLRDIQAILVAPCARFFISLPVVFMALAGLFAITFLRSPATARWGVGLAVVGAAWVAVSAGWSCRCRLYTAVSKDDLPSLYRTWTARRFLRQVQPRIHEVQGIQEVYGPGSAGWAEAESRHAGSAAAATAPVEPRPRNIVYGHTLLSDLFLLSLAASAIVGLAT